MHHFRNCAFYEPAMQVLCGKEKAIFVMSHDFEKYVHLFPFCQEVQSDWWKKSSLSVTIVTLTIKYTCCKRCNFSLKWAADILILGEYYDYIKYVFLQTIPYCGS